MGAIAFYNALRLSSWFFLKVIVGYSIPTPYGEGNALSTAHFARPWLLPIVVGLGALLGAVLVVRVAPEAEGHGTDAAIAAVHYNPRGIRFRTVLVKIVASALTIGSGGSGGREGPTGQISAGFGSFLSRFFDLSPSDARLAVSAGIGSGIGAIFGAPLAGSILATEIMYRDDFEVDALLPSFIASVSAYGLWGSVEGFGPLFGYAHNYHLANATQFFWFAVLGVVGTGLREGLLRSREPVRAITSAQVAASRPRRTVRRTHRTRNTPGARHRLRVDPTESRCTPARDALVDRPRDSRGARARDGTLHWLGRFGGHLWPGHGNWRLRGGLALATHRAPRAKRGA
jgi:hypothetical protein